jgi:hypothetical protein
VFKGTKYNIKWKDYGFLTYIKLNQNKLIKQRRDYFIFTDFLNTYLFNARMNKYRARLFHTVRESVANFETKGYIRVYYLRDLYTIAPEVITRLM